MKCPVCKTPPLEPALPEPGLSAHTCGACNGVFLHFERYLGWVESQPSTPEASASEGHAITGLESPGAKLCPDCGRFMARFRIRADLPFVVERCGGCSALWLDGGEWASLRERGLHTQLNRATSEAWQHRLRTEIARAEQEDRYRRLLGDDGYTRVQEFKRWLKTQPKPQVVWAYLEDREVP
jgi:Zn-finger nucleic acid-binding protein